MDNNQTDIGEYKDAEKKDILEDLRKKSGSRQNLNLLIGSLSLVIIFSATNDILIVLGMLSFAWGMRDYVLTDAYIDSYDKILGYLQYEDK